MKKTFLLAAAVLLAVAAVAADKVTVTVRNTLNTARSGEMVEVDMKQVKTRLDGAQTVVVTDADGREIPSQVTYDGKLIFQAGVAAKGKSVYYVCAGQPARYDARVYGRQFPERVDDIAWENDRVAFRCYGPALQRSGERAWGYDIWNKRTSELVVEDRYAGELDPDVQKAIAKLRKMGKGDIADDVYNAISYHVDHGNGMDCYKVGPTLGCGTNALMHDGQIVYPRCYKSFEILDKGPLRFTVKLVYGEETVGDMKVTEARVLSLDAGSQLNKVTVSYTGLAGETPLAVGIVVHNENPNAYVLSPGNGYMGYEDLGDPNQYKEKYRATQNKDFGKIYVGTVCAGKVDGMQFKEEKGLPGATGHILSLSHINGKSSFTYYFGSGWSRNDETQFHSLTDWESYLSAFSSHVKSPLKITVK